LVVLTTTAIAISVTTAGLVAYIGFLPAGGAAIYSVVQ